MLCIPGRRSGRCLLDFCIGRANAVVVRAAWQIAERVKENGLIMNAAQPAVERSEYKNMNGERAV